MSADRSRAAVGRRGASTPAAGSHNGEPVLTDGPFAETKEMFFSFYVLELEDLDAAVAWAAKLPVAEYGAVEIRPTIGFDLP